MLRIQACGLKSSAAIFGWIICMFFICEKRGFVLRKALGGSVCSGQLAVAAW